jgi:hypothetical protein
MALTILRSGEGRCDTLVEDTEMNVTDPIREPDATALPGPAILPAHDPGAADRLAQATGQACRPAGR